MHVTINGRKETLTGQVSLLDFIKEKGLNKDKIVIEKNSEIIDKENLSTTLINKDDTIEIVAFVGGG